MKYVRVLINNPDGGVAIMQFLTDDTHGLKREATVENITAEIIKSGVPNTGWRIINDDELPQDRTFRDAWKDDGQKIDHDMDKVYAIHEGRVKHIVKMKTMEMAHEVMEALLDDNVPEMTRLRNKRKALMDIASIDVKKMKTVNEVKAVLSEARKEALK